MSAQVLAMMIVTFRELWRRADAWPVNPKATTGTARAFIFSLVAHVHVRDMLTVFFFFSNWIDSDDDELKKALALSKKEEQDRAKKVEQYNEFSMTEDWEADAKYVFLIAQCLANCMYGVS